MLPDGAHNRDQDWTVFFLNQTAPAAVRAHPLAHPSPQVLKAVCVVGGGALVRVATDRLPNGRQHRSSSVG